MCGIGWAAATAGGAAMKMKSTWNLFTFRSKWHLASAGRWYWLTNLCNLLGLWRLAQWANAAGDDRMQRVDEAIARMNQEIKRKREDVA